MPKYDVVGTVVALLFNRVPRRRAFFLFGKERVPTMTVVSAQVILAAIGLGAGLRWPERAKPFINVQLGFSIEGVIENIAEIVDEEVKTSQADSPALRLWSAAHVDDSMITIGWYPFKNLDAIGPAAYAAGTAAAIKRSDAETWLRSWLDGVGNIWHRASKDAGLAIEGPAPSYEALMKSIDDLLAIVETEELADEPPPSWPIIEYLWRLEGYRMALLFVRSVGWREPEQEEYRGILY